MTKTCYRRPPRVRQAGVALFVALIALVAITLAAVALVRSIDTGLVIAGNTAFKQATTAAADVATDAATTWIANNNDPVTLSTTNPAVAYYANWKNACDMTGNRTPTGNSDDVGWTTALGNACGMTAVDAPSMPVGYTASYVITRMCLCDGSAFGQCAGPPIVDNACVGVAGMKGFHDTPDYAQRGLTGEEKSKIAAGWSPYYRVITRVVGPRNTNSFVETVVTLN